MNNTNTPIFITGCQRSGTTLLSLILDSHPEIHGIDEMEYRLEDQQLYLTHSNYHPYVSFKLPTFSSALDSFKEFPNMKMLWCIRDYRDVISSMLKLHLPFNDISIPWVIHPLGGQREIVNIEMALKNKMNDELLKLLLTYRRIIAAPLNTKFSSEELVFVGALCWRLKQELLKLYDMNRIDYRIVSYERLITNPKKEIHKILLSLKIQWHDNVLNHHNLHSGFSVGNTDNTRPIDKSNMGKWRKHLHSNDIAIIDEICMNTALKFGYK